MDVWIVEERGFSVTALIKDCYKTSLQLPTKILLYIQFFPHDLELAYNQQLQVHS